MAWESKNVIEVEVETYLGYTANKARNRLEQHLGIISMDKVVTTLWTRGVRIRISRDGLENLKL